MFTIWALPCPRLWKLFICCCCCCCLIELPDSGWRLPLLHRTLDSWSPAVRAHLANHPFCHQALLWKLMPCSERTAMQRRGRIWFFILPARKAASGNEELLVLGAWLSRQSITCCCGWGVTQWRGTGLLWLREEVRKGTLDPAFSETHFFFPQREAHVFQNDK